MMRIALCLNINQLTHSSPGMVFSFHQIDLLLQSHSISQWVKGFSIFVWDKYKAWMHWIYFFGRWKKDSFRWNLGRIKMQGL